eukprot:1272055-Rhodomonas_salina.1
MASVVMCICYAVSGTDLGAAGTRVVVGNDKEGCIVTVKATVKSAMAAYSRPRGSPPRPRSEVAAPLSSYAMFGTEVGYAAAIRYAMSGTHVGYAASICWAMFGADVAFASTIC